MSAAPAATTTGPASFTGTNAASSDVASRSLSDIWTRFGTTAPSGIPLLTRWSEPADCKTNWVTWDKPWLTDLAYAKHLWRPGNAFEDFTMPSDSAFTSCRPHSISVPLYSPGVCPEGQVIGNFDRQVYTTKSSDSIEYTLYVGGCCSSDWPLISYGGVECRSPTSSITAMLPVTYTLEDGDSRTYTAWTAVIWDSSVSSYRSISSPTVMAPVTLASPVVVVAWQLTDLDAFPPDYASSLAQMMDVSWTASATGSPTGPTTASSPNLPPAASSPSLTTGAKAGIGVGVTVGAILVGALIIFFLLRRRKQRANSTPRDEVEETPVPEMEDQDHDHATRKWFIGGKWRSEVKAENNPSELDSRNVNVVPGPPVELEAAERTHGPDGRWEGRT